MNRRAFILMMIVFGLSLEAPSLLEADSHSHKKEAFYYTCPMHPQIHQDNPGKCPICHMDLVKVEESSAVEPAQEKLDDRRSLKLSDRKIESAGTQKIKVERGTMMLEIPFSGRFISSSLVAFQAYENDLPYLKTGIRFSGRATVLNDEELEGIISSVDSIVDPTSRTVRVVGQIKNNLKRILIESSFSGRLKIELKDRLVILENSVIHTGSGDLVYIIDKGSISARSVTLGAKASGKYEVLSGISENDSILSGPNFLIDSEAKIRGAND